MSWTPTERVREAAFDALQNTSATLSARDRLDAVLVAVGPMIAEAAWDEGVALGYEYGRYDQNMFHANAVPTNNPYRPEDGHD